jgi:hypothetical protein
VREGKFAITNGRPVLWEEFYFDDGTPIYTDGSANQVRWPAIAVAASSAFQIDRGGLHRLLVVQLPAAYRISAVASEFFAFSMVIRALPPGEPKLEIVADCQAVIQAFRELGQHANYRSRFGGMWREQGLD